MPMTDPPSGLLAAYLERLPRGLASHPEAQVKGSVVRALVSTSPIAVPRDALPPELLLLVDDPPLPNAWVHEVAVLALGLAFEERMPPAEHEAWVESRNRKLLTNPLYRILFAAIGPERLLTGLSNRWSAFRRGSSIEVTERRPGWVALTLTYPPHLHSPETLHNFAVSFRVTALSAGAKHVIVRVDERSPTTAVFTFDWS